MLQVIEANLASSIRKASHSSVWFATFRILAKASRAAQNVPHITKILQNFWLTSFDFDDELIYKKIICIKQFFNNKVQS